ncbi:hypothetical protein [Candidatus Nanohalococcus occultus]|uniref:Uncharacterized protein n=1 Tax=Candidatus Nanohalococcus occultus TaxID=2978047 RepID=A0ABY8CDI4_9ARCH|nr:hypothetical protein SVXNc_0251 [Candidatus Nanohaloarchaeota archaeon SVXNc]
MRGQEFRKEEKLRDLIDVDDAFESSRSDRKDTLKTLEDRRRGFEQEAMEKTQRAVLKELVPQIIEAVEARNRELVENLQASIEDAKSEIETEIRHRDERIDGIESEVDSMKDERKRELEDIHDRISSVQKRIERDTDKIDDKVESEVQERMESLHSKMEKNANRIEEVSRKSDVESLEELEEQLDEFEKRFEDKTGEIEQVKERLENDELVASDADIMDLEEKVKEHQRQVQKLEDRIDELSEIEVDQKLKEEIVNEIKDESSVKTSRKPSKDSGDVRKPGDITEETVGDEVKVKGRLQFKKEAGGRRFYKISGKKGSVVVAAERKIPEGPRTLEGKVKNVKGNVCLVVD